MELVNHDFIVQQPDVEVVRRTFNNSLPQIAMMWRFLAAEDPDVDVFLIRDLDSRLSLRERYGKLIT